jgi:hypothetical protein
MPHRQTALAGLYDPLAVRMMDYRGWSVPGSFRNADAEFDSMARTVGLLETPWVGLLEVQGKDHRDLLHRISTNDLLHLEAGRVQGTLFLSDKARLHDLAFCAAEESSLLMLLSAERERSIVELIGRHTILEDVQVRSVSDEHAVFSLVGPRAIDAGGGIAGGQLRANTCRRQVFPFGRALVAAVASTRWQAVHLLVPHGQAQSAWEWLVKECSRIGVSAVGAEAWELYRICAGIPRADAEITPAFTPYDAGLIEFVSFTKGCYIGQEVVARIDTYGKQKRTLAGLLFDGTPELEKLPTPLTHGGVDAGLLTSVSGLPFRGRRAGLAVLPLDLVREEGRVEIEREGIRSSASVHSLPVVME